MLKVKTKSNWPYALAIIIIGLAAFWLRILPAKTVFLPNGFVKFVSNDAWYHIRTLNILIKNYPREMFYDPITNYPTGSYIHFGPLFDQMIAVPTLILGLGHPSQEFVNYIAAYFPAVLGALTVIPVYYIGKFLGGRKTGILASILIAFTPGQFLDRSMIGFTDHHVAEALFSTFFIMFFMLGLISAKKSNLIFEHVVNKRIDVIKEPLIYSVMAGLMYSAYQLIWPGAPLFALIIMVYAISQFILNNLRNESSDYLGIVGISAFLVSAVLILPFIHPEMGFSIYYYSWFHLATALGTLIGFIVLILIEKILIKNGVSSYFYPLAIFGIGVIGLMAVIIVYPPLYSIITKVLSEVFGIRQGGMSSVAEASPIFLEGNNFTLSKVFGNFTASGFLASILGIFILITNTYRKPKSEELLTLIWTFFIFLAIYSQNRYAYYYSVNVSVLSAFVGGLLLEKVKWNELDDKFCANVKSLADIPGFLKLVKIEQVHAVVIVFCLLIIPVLGSALQYAGGSNDPNNEWMEACFWLRSNTPDTGMNYNTIYDSPSKGELSTKGELFIYPDTAYGVMSWWDMGHYIEVIGDRMPNANPFQAGIGGRNENINDTVRPGAATFFIAQSENEASEVLKAIDPRPDRMGARYIITDANLATDGFMSIPAWMFDTEDYFISNQTESEDYYLPSTRYFNSMIVRLHIFDGNGLKQYRMIHETKPNKTSEVKYKQAYNSLYKGSVPEVDTGYVKIFEYVKGAKISGTAPPDEIVKINASILTGQNRTFEYIQSTTSDSKGRYDFIVPYSTEGPIPGETQFDIAPSCPYKLSYGNTTKELRIKEETVLKGENVKV